MKGKFDHMKSFFFFSFISVGLAAGKEILSCGSDGLLILRLIDLISERHYFQGKKEKLSKVRG